MELGKIQQVEDSTFLWSFPYCFSCKKTTDIKESFTKRNLIYIKSPKFATSDGVEWFFEFAENTGFTLKKLSLSKSQYDVSVKIIQGLGLKLKKTVYPESVIKFTFEQSNTLNVANFCKKSGIEYAPCNLYLDHKDVKFEIYCELRVSNVDDKENGKDSNFEALLKDDQFSDVTLIVSGTEFKVHRAILAGKSPVFRNMFMRLDSKGAKVEIKDVDPEVMKQVLLYTYAGKVNEEILKKMPSSVFLAADKFEIDDMKEICIDAIIQNLTLDDVFETLALAKKNQINHLIKRTMEFIGLHIRSITDKMINEPGYPRTVKF